MAYRLVDAQPFWVHDGSTAISGISGAAPGVLLFRPNGESNGTMVAPTAGLASDWVEVKCDGIDHLIFWTEINVDAVGDLGGGVPAAANTRLTAIGSAYNSPLINEPPEPATRNPNDSDVANPTAEQMLLTGLQVIPFQTTEAWSPDTDDAQVSTDANLIAVGITPATGLRLSWGLAVGNFPQTGSAPTSDNSISIDRLNVKFLSRVWISVMGVNNPNALSSWDGTERLKVDMRILKFTESSIPF